MSPRIRFEPIGEEIEAAPGETVLDAAFRSGYNLVHGCREGQCSACKCFLLEGEVALKPHSSFALSDSEQAGGYSLMCRALPEQDVVIELLHFDPDDYRLEHPIRDGRAVVEKVSALTHDITRLVLGVEEPAEFGFVPGQYVDLHVPGETGLRRSFSLANLPGEDRLELIIKRYPGGKLSSLLDGRIAPGDQLDFTGPYGSFHLREGVAPILMVAGGSGLAPVLSVLRQLAATGCERPVRFFYGARAERDLFHLEQIEALGTRLADFRFTSVLSERDGFVHEALDAYLTGGEIAAPDVYMCGPPPMLDAAEQVLLEGHGLNQQRIFTDRFTTSADADPGIARTARASTNRVADSEREFDWFVPHGRRGSLYEDVTVDTQPSVHRHLTRGWPVSFEDGRGTWSDDSTALRSTDWFAFRDPGEQWERPFYQAAAGLERQIETALSSAAGDGLLEDFSPAWIEFLRGFLQVPAYVEHGLWFATATAARDCLSDSVSQCVCLQAAMKQRSAQAIVLYAMDLEPHLGELPIEAAKQAFLTEPAWQPTRSYLERLAHTIDWGEVIVGANLCFEPLIGTLLRRELATRAATINGDSVTPVIARGATQEWEWVRAWTVELTRFLLADPGHGEANRELLTQWIAAWRPRALEAARALALLAAAAPGARGVGVTLERIDAYAAAMHSEAGLGGRPAAVPHDRARRRRRRSVGAEPEPTAPRPAAPAPASPGTYDYVGIVMAKSAEGDAVAEVLGRRAETEVIEQASFWDIRARDRLVIPYDEVCDQLGYEIDAYSIQHEMSTHYGRMVATDEAIMLFSDPTEAMQYLMS